MTQNLLRLRLQCDRKFVAPHVGFVLQTANALRINYVPFPGVGMRLDQTLIGLLAWALLFVSANAAPQKASFASDVSTTQWPLADIDPQLAVRLDATPNSW